MKRTEPYTGPFPRKRHSHRCLGCQRSSKYTWYNGVACYKSRCTKPQTVETCYLCSPRISDSYQRYLADKAVNDYAGDGLDARYEDDCKERCGL